MTDNLRSNKILSTFLFCFFLMALGSFGIRLRWSYILMFCVVLFTAMQYKIIKVCIDNVQRKWFFLLTVIFVLHFLPNASHESDAYNELIYLAIPAIVLFLCQTNKYELIKTEKIIIKAAIIVAIYISFFRIFSELYFSLIGPLLSSEAYARVSNNYRFGYGVAIGNSYTFSDYIIMMGIAFLAGKDISTGGKKIKNKILMLVLFGGMVLEGRKGELISALLAVIIIYLIHTDFKKIKNLSKKILVFIVIVTVLVISMAYLIRHGYLIRFQQLFKNIVLFQTGSEVDFSSGRLSLWKNAIDIFLEHPFIGIGWGKFANYTTGVYQSNISTLAVRDTHNVILQLLCENGIIGTVFVLAPIFSIIKISFKHTLKVKKNRYNCIEESRYNIFALTLLVFFFLLSFVDPVLYNNYFWCAFVIAIIYEGNSILFNVFSDKKKVIKK